MKSYTIFNKNTKKNKEISKWNFIAYSYSLGSNNFYEFQIKFVVR